jgi:hypothetical protein
MDNDLLDAVGAAVGSAYGPLPDIDACRLARQIAIRVSTSQPVPSRLSPQQTAYLRAAIASGEDGTRLDRAVAVAVDFVASKSELVPGDTRFCCKCGGPAVPVQNTSCDVILYDSSGPRQVREHAYKCVDEEDCGCTIRHTYQSTRDGRMTMSATDLPPVLSLSRRKAYTASLVRACMYEW